MKPYVPREKRSKKARRQLDLAGRTGWGAISPVTRVVPNKKAYNRKRVGRKEDSFDLPTRLFFSPPEETPYFPVMGFAFSLVCLAFP